MFMLTLRSTWSINGAPSLLDLTRPRIGRVKIARGLDALDGSFPTVYGQTALTFFEVWSDQVNPNLVSIGDPIDVSKRLDGTPQIRFI